MNWRIAFRDAVAVKADYDHLVSMLMKKKGARIFVSGNVDKHQTKLFFDYWDPLRPKSGSFVPVCEVYFKNEKDKDGNILVSFKIANLLLYLCVAIFFGTCYLAFFIAPDLTQAIWVPIGTFALLYLYLWNRFRMNRKGIIEELKGL